MATIKIEFPADRPDIAAVFATALSAIGGNAPELRVTVERNAPALAAAHAGAATTETPVTDTADAGEEPIERVDVPPPAEPTTDERTDQHGVAFNPEYCGNAAEPFYGTGKRAGQWKKRKGVDEAAYDEWYASARTVEPLPASTSLSAEPEPAAVDTTAAFAPPGAPATPPVADAPKDAGSLLHWVSEHTVAGKLQQTDVQAAYAECHVGMSDLFGPNSADCVAKLYAVLSAKAGA